MIIRDCADMTEALHDIIIVNNSDDSTFSNVKDVSYHKDGGVYVECTNGKAFKIDVTQCKAVSTRAKKSVDGHLFFIVPMFVDDVSGYIKDEMREVLAHRYSPAVSDVELDEASNAVFSIVPENNDFGCVADAVEYLRQSTRGSVAVRAEDDDGDIVRVIIVRYNIVA